MTPQVLLDALRQLLRTVPALEGRGDYGNEQREWLGRATALIAEWNAAQGMGFRVEARNMAANFNRQGNYGRVLMTIHEAIAAIEHGLPADAGQVFGPGAVYDFFRALNELVDGADSDEFGTAI